MSIMCGTMERISSTRILSLCGKRKAGTRGSGQRFSKKRARSMLSWRPSIMTDSAFSQAGIRSSTLWKWGPKRTLPENWQRLSETRGCGWDYIIRDWSTGSMPMIRSLRMTTFLERQAPPMRMRTIPTTRWWSWSIPMSRACSGMISGGRSRMRRQCLICSRIIITRCRRAWSMTVSTEGTMISWQRNIRQARWTEARNGKCAEEWAYPLDIMRSKGTMSFCPAAHSPTLSIRCSECILTVQLEGISCLHESVYTIWLQKAIEKRFVFKS